MRRLALPALLLVAGCGLPLPEGAQEPRQVPVAQQQPGGIKVLPPGPRAANTPEEVVRGFFDAQSNPDDRHASARAFLRADRRATWNDGGPVDVFESGLDTAIVDGRPDLISVTATRLGRIEADGSYSRAPVGSTISVEVGLARNEQREWEIVEVPDGLLLSAADRDRSFRWRSVYFLAPTPRAGTPTLSVEASRAHLVPDPVFVPVDADQAQALVERLLAGPSRPLDSSVVTSVPPGTTLLRPVSTDAAGVVTVDLSEQVAQATDSQKEQLSAQLIWTLREAGASFSQLRLRSAGEPVLIPSSGVNGPLQARDNWESYDPDGLAPEVTAQYVSGRRLRSLGEQLPGPLADERGRQPVDEAAVAVRGGTYAILTREGRTAVLRTGPAAGPFTRRSAGPGLSSLSWGSGEYGVWYLDAGRVMVAPTSGGPYGVPLDGINRFGPVSAVRVSRDGARVALIAGVGERRRLVVGRVQLSGAQVRVVALRDVAPTVEDVRSVSWESATALVVLGRVALPPALLPVRVAVDGSSVAPDLRLGLESSEPGSLAAAPGRPLVVGAITRGVPTLFGDSGRLFVQRGRGYAPFYPG